MLPPTPVSRERRGWVWRGSYPSSNLEASLGFGFASPPPPQLEKCKNVKQYLIFLKKTNKDKNIENFTKNDKKQKQLEMHKKRTNE